MMVPLVYCTISATEQQEKSDLYWYIFVLMPEGCLKTSYNVETKE